MQFGLLLSVSVSPAQQGSHGEAVMTGREVGRTIKDVQNQNKEIQKIEKLANWLDASIRLPGGFRIGWDGVLGMIPGVGDAGTALISVYLIMQARRTGVGGFVVFRMVTNVVIETIIGAIPVIGDIFDFYYKANLRNIKILKKKLRE